MANWTGNAYVDALLLGQKWGTTNFTYFLKGGGSTWNTIETNAMQAALQAWEDVANITFTQVFIEGAADFVEDQYTGSAGSLGVHGIHVDYTTTTITTNNSQLSGSYNYDGFGWDENDANGGLQVGGLGYLTIVHEIGHGLGLDHTHDDGGGNVNFFPGVSSSSDSGNNNLNQDVFSTMSYVHGIVGKSLDGGASTDNYGYVAGPMAFDIATIQYLYGANTSQNTGNDTYILPDANASGTYFSAIWDAGGIDEIVYLGAINTTIDLRSATLADEIGGGGFVSQADSILGGFTIANDFTNALSDVNGETGVIIENASGGSGSDTITGNEVANIINGNAGNDGIIAAGGDDQVNGGDGVDYLQGNNGADTIVGGGDADTIDGGAGDDIIYGDNLDGSGRLGSSGISLGSGQINKVGGNISIATAQDISNEFSVANDAEIADSTTIPHVSVLGTGDGNVDYYKITLNNANVAIMLDIDHGDEGSTPADFDTEISIYLANGSFVANNDDNAGDVGSTGTFDSALTHTFVDAGTYYIAVGNFSSGSTDPNIIPTGGTYELQISVSGEIINNDDVILAGAGNDTIHASVGNDTISGGADVDTYDFSHDTQGVIIDLAAVSANAIGVGIGTDDLSSIEHIIAGSGNDSLTGGIFDDNLEGGAGNDTLFGAEGNDILDGGAGTDTYDASSVVFDVTVNLAAGTASGNTVDNDTLANIENATTGAGNDILTGSNVVNVLHGGAGTDTINGGSAGDTLFGDAGVDTIYGDAGADTIYGGTENDNLFGNAFTDTLYGEAGNDTLNGGSGQDTLFGGIGDDDLFGGSGKDELHGGADNDDLFGNGADDTLFGDAGIDNLFGGSGVDTIHGGSGADHIEGGGGLDTLNGDAGIDEIFGNSGDDIINGGSEGDNLFGGLDNDTVHGDDGADHIEGASGNDFLYGDAGIDEIFGNNGNDEIHGGAEGDMIYAGSGIDTIFGDDGDDIIDSHGGNDIIDGGIGNDTIRGFTGTDSITGGSGNDTMTGGDNTDTFIYLTGIFNNDTITDFFDVNGGNDDLIDFSGSANINVLADLTITYTADALITTVDGTITLTGITGGLDATDFIF